MSKDKAHGHGERKHSKYAASAAQRWLICSGSVALCEGLPDKETPWSKEGTHAHEVLEAFTRMALSNGKPLAEHERTFNTAPVEMRNHAIVAANYMLDQYEKIEGEKEIVIEERVTLEFIDPEMFGTLDFAAVEHFGELHVIDYKYGQGHIVSPKENWQLLFYAIGIAAKYDWNFKTIRLTVFQPRAPNFDPKNPPTWEVDAWIAREKYAWGLQKGVERIREGRTILKEGEWCHFCKAKSICPEKQKGRTTRAHELFKSTPIKSKDVDEIFTPIKKGGLNGEKENGQKGRQENSLEKEVRKADKKLKDFIEEKPKGKKRLKEKDETYVGDIEAQAKEDQGSNDFF